MKIIQIIDYFFEVYLPLDFGGNRKTVKLETPNGDDPNNIDIDYHCDQYLDCNNMSDEGYECGSSILPAFIVFGIVTGLLIINAVILLIFTVLFGLIPPLRARRVKFADPFFLITIILACIYGMLRYFYSFDSPFEA